jgi:hypothetical protein
MTAAPTAEEIRGWPVTVDVVTAGRCFQLGRDASYDAARRGEFPVPVIRVGRRLVVVTAALRSTLGVEDRPGAITRAMEEPHEPRNRSNAEEAA